MSSNKRDWQTYTEDEDDFAFSSSKIILRSPQFRQRQENEHKMNESTIAQILQEIKEIRLDMRKKDENMVNVIEEIKELRKDMKRKDEIMAEMMAEIKNLKAEKNIFEEKWSEDKNSILGKVDRIEDRLESNEKRERKLNIVITGLDIQDLENNELDNFFRNKLGTEKHFNNAHFLGKSKKRILVKMNTWEDKVEVLKSKKNLKDTDIYIDNDLTKEERRIQAEIRALAKEEKSKGKSVKIGYQKLKINEQEFLWSKKDEGMVPARQGPNGSKN